MTESDEHSPVAAHESRVSGRAAAAYARFRDHPRSGLVEAAAFWLAIALPVVYLPALATGIDGDVASLRFGALLALHALCLLLGHSHRT